MTRRCLTVTCAFVWLLQASSTTSSAMTAVTAPAAVAGDEPGAQAAWIAERVDVRLVNIDVRVTDRSGRRVSDLVREDFVLEEDGKPVPIVNFTAPAVGEAAPATPTTRTAAEPAPQAESSTLASPPELETTIFLFDDLHLTGASRAHVIAGLRQRLEAGAFGERIVVVTYGRDGLNVRAPLGSPSADVVRALAAMPQPVGVLSASELQSTLRTLRDMQRSAYEGKRWRIEPPCSTKISQGAVNYGQWARSQARATLGAVTQLLDSLAAMPGRKQLFFVTDGLPLQPGLEAFEALRVLCDGTGLRQGLQYSVDVDQEPELQDNALVYRPSQAMMASASLNIASALQTVSIHANSAGVEMSTVQASGIAAGNAEASEGVNRTTTQEERGAATENLRDPLTQLASETGGEAVLNTNDFGSAIGESVEDFRGVYSLGFAPVRAGDDRVHTLRLTTRRPGLTLSYRRSFRDASSATEIAQQLYGSLLHGLWRDPWGVGLNVQELPAVAVFNLVIPVDRLATLPDQAGGAAHASLTIFIAMRSADGSLTPVRQVRVPVSLTKEQTAAGRFVYGIRVKRPAGEHTIALLVRDDVSADTVLVRKAFRIPAS